MAEGEGIFDVDWRKDQNHDGKRNFPIIVLGWFSCDIIRDCLRSINLLEGVNPQIYFVENKSKNSDKIKELILNTPNIRSYIQYKENFAANTWKVTLEHFLPKIEEKFITITDGDYIFDVDAMDTQYALFEKYDNVGITSQKRSYLGLHAKGNSFESVRHCYNAWEAQMNQHIISPSLKRGVFNSMLLTTARKTDWQKLIDCVNRRDILMATTSLNNAAEAQYRPPIFWDGDMYRFFEIVMGKQSLIVQTFPAYHLTDEHAMDPNSEYSIEKEKFNYEKSWSNYQENFEYFHDDHYPNGELKFNIIL